MKPIKESEIKSKLKLAENHFNTFSKVVVSDLEKFILNILKSKDSDQSKIKDVFEEKMKCEIKIDNFIVDNYNATEGIYVNGLYLYSDSSHIFAELQCGVASKIRKKLNNLYLQFLSDFDDNSQASF